MKELFAKRLKSARVRAGMSQDELVHRMDNIVSKNSISKYEKAEMLPDSKVLVALAKALDVKTDYFFREFKVEIENIEFRKKRLGVKKVNAIKEKVIDNVERYLELEQFLGLTSTFENPIVSLKINSKNDVENAVNHLLEGWKIGYNALPNVIDLLEDKHIKVIEIDAPAEFDGFSGWADGTFPVIVLNQNYGLERKRFTALHELGHLVLQFDSGIEHKVIEKMCHQFAGAMLMPEKTFKREFGGKRSSLSLNELISIKEEYGISIQAIMARAKDFEFISENRYRSFRIYISKNREEKDLGQYIGRESSHRFKQLLYRAASEEIISMSKAANLSNQKLAAFRKELIAI
ncbi:MULTISPECIES: helix-turn-helix domain-containing protein [Leeuwenhoekiella]|jgi:Zn-dependent peptidase ImmA (M78 family)/DNA-binding XRE family transcriptional regulator|uniref:helix-turn-helix domain-containing protein n=1 Tax=Leeuwenhoekiella TaxID=283735 RepID=UPI000C4213AE|nr:MULTISPECIES: XRE family transcriptional regulator [Leeuwenhoekiella]MAO45307.1 DNA-binding protein [Leeuwenhoekiella sp.]|tara:strand:- start:1992 stop:3035 length:1044 start_codon:yes stop_codon:yes gene_type:complete